jgi:hypothetical protein
MTPVNRQSSRGFLYYHFERLFNIATNGKVLPKCWK